MKRWSIWIVCIAVSCGMWLNSSACGDPQPTEKTEEKTLPTDAAAEVTTEPTTEPVAEPVVEATAEPVAEAPVVPDAAPPEPTQEAAPELPPERAAPPPAKPIVYYTVTVRGKLKGTADEAKATHNKIIADAGPTAEKLGDMSHHAFLSATDPTQFLGIDVWRDLEGLNQFLTNPDVQKSFGALFDGAPDIKVWINRDGFKQYSENDPSGKEHTRVMVRGTLKGDEAASKTLHNQIVDGALGGNPDIRSLGDLSHHVFANPQEPKAFQAFDVWNNPAEMDKFLKDPNVQQAFGQLFDGVPDITIWKKADGFTIVETTLYTVTVRGKLKGTAAEAKATHNQIISGASGAARELGDLSHNAYLLTTDPQQFLGLDVWASQDGLNKFLTDPNVQQAFGALFDGAPDIKVWVDRPSFKQYWENDLSGKAHLRVMVRGTLKGDEDASKTLHNQIVDGALGGNPSIRSLGDLSHQVYADPKDPKAFQGFDIWNDANGLDMFFKDPNVQMAFGQLFSAVPDITVWKAADGFETY